MSTGITKACSVSCIQSKQGEMYCIYSIEINGREEEDNWTGVLQSLLE